MTHVSRHCRLLARRKGQMNSEYRAAREALGVRFSDILDEINRELEPIGQRMSLTSLFRLDVGLRRIHDVKYMVALKIYKRLYEQHERQKRFREIDEKYGG